jgi:hypothetical protein
VLREGGGLIDLPRADNPLLFSEPTGLTFPLNGGQRTVTLSDAGGGSGTWSVAVQLQNPTAGVSVTADPATSVPGPLTLTASVADGVGNANVTGFVVLTRGSDTRRIPFWLEINHPLLASEPATTLTAPGTYAGTTAGKPSNVTSYRFPTGSDASYPGPEAVYRVKLAKRVANFGVVMVSGKAVPHVTFAGDENHLVGYPGLPLALNPYARGYGDARPIVGAVLPEPGSYDVVFDTRAPADAGPFKFRFWVNDTTPPLISVSTPTSRTITVKVTDAGAGVDPESLRATVDGSTIPVHFADGEFRVHALPGRHRVAITASDYQEAKNMEDVVAIRPNTRRVVRTVFVR